MRPTFVGQLASIRKVIAVLLFIMSLFTVSAKEVDLSNVKLEVSSNLTTESTELTYDFTNNTKKAFDWRVSIDKLEVKDGDGWKEIPIIPDFNQFDLDKVTYDELMPTGTYRYKVNIKGMIGQDTFDEGVYKMTVSFETAGDYKVQQTGTASCEFTVAA